MKTVIALLIFLSQTLFAASGSDTPLDFKIGNPLPRPGQIVYGWKLMPWQEWLQRPSAGPLLIETAHPKNDIEVFEAKAAAVVNKPVTLFTEQYLLNINTIRKLNPKNNHQQIQGPRFTVETTIPFPKNWSEFIYVAKKTKLLADKTHDYIRMENSFAYADKKTILASPELQRIVKLLDVTGQVPEALSLQGTNKVSQIADFISVVNLFYKVDDQRTLIVTNVAAAIKKHILNMGVSAYGMTLNGRSVLLGESPKLNSPDGIGAGLPKYFELFYRDMITNVQN